MTEEEKEQKENSLKATRKSYETSRTLCAAVIVFLIYSTFKNDEFSSSPWYILLIMGILTLGAVAVLVRVSLIIRKLNKQLKLLESGDFGSENSTNTTASTEKK